MTKTIEATWQLLQQHQGETFHTAKGLPFTYTIRGGELFVNRRRKSITVSTVRRALEKITQLEAAGEIITGPKKIGCYGASYLYPVLLALDVLERPALPGQEEFTDAAARPNRQCRASAVRPPTGQTASAIQDDVPHRKDPSSVPDLHYLP